MKKYVWLNLETGEFSNSWNEEEYTKVRNVLMNDEVKIKYPLWKLIEYDCLNDGDFKFNHNMRLQ